MTSHMFSRSVTQSLIVLVQDADPPSDSEWDVFLDQLKGAMPRVKMLAVTRGGAPNASQRARLEKTLAGMRFPTAVMTDSVKVRFVAVTILLFHKDHRAFALDEMDAASTHLGLTPTERALANETVAEMGGRLWTGPLAYRWQ